MSALSAARLRARLGKQKIGREIVVLEETTSTNDAILHRAIPETPEGLVVFAELQTAGRGQRTNVWESAAQKGLWFSILLRPKIDIADAPQLSGWAAETVARTIQQEFRLSPSVKPPNDVYVGDKKVAGVLVEMRARSDGPHIAIVGIGVNVNHAPTDFSERLRARAASLSMVLDREVEREIFAVALLRELDRSYAAIFA
ncbi:MAG TPA: biotin--[acetyl-CoA-carboxylase] ligase [Chthoniobacterales bacterium]|jgi:BirA family biotin operon repressor/biotin-[acetyl-CoA-carboxylase] ligase|nr:biotin--[acetyl-CoA-carboxylase] ligase [Chthoniobacterales bacterium]